MKYQVWEIAIFTAFLLFGFKVGFSISVINTLILFVFFPGDLPTGPFYNFLAIISTLLGIYIIQRISQNLKKKKEALYVILITLFGILFRVIAMTIVNYIVLPLGTPFGYSVSIEALPTFLSVTALFNGTIVLYTIPIAYILARTVNKNTKIQIW